MSSTSTHLGAVYRRIPHVASALLISLLLTAILGLWSAAVAADTELVERMRAGGHVLLLRHAYAPGTGDPSNFRLGDCATQRNLSQEGRDQARAIGQWLRERGIGRARVYSSEWCRCMETADLLELGPVKALPGLNSFYDRPQDRVPNLNAVKDFLALQPPRGELLILVTHQVNITALTGDYMDSGHGVVADLGAGGVLRPIGRLSFGE